jgi:hypothetical protein|tara:strand:+ start:9038 stop:9277 length:240 start_codon:yes stop_codon:yes gene_type:complete
MLQKKGWLAKATAKKNGYFKRGELLKKANLTQEECDLFNGAVEEVVVEEVVVEETPEVAEDKVEESIDGPLKSLFKKLI